MHNALSLLLFTIITVIGMFVIATSIPLGSPHIYAYCLLSQIGTVPVDSDAFRIFCTKAPTTPADDRGRDESTDNRLQNLLDSDKYDRYVPYFYGPNQSVRED